MHLYSKVSINMVSPTVDGRNPPEQLRYIETMENPLKAGSYPSQLATKISSKVSQSTLNHRWLSEFPAMTCCCSQ